MANNYTEVQQAIRALDPFNHPTCSARDFRGVRNPAGAGTGHMNFEDRVSLTRDYQDAEPYSAFYVVYSYSTPIGWSWLDAVTQTRMRRIPATKYSATTSKQQTYVRANLPGKDA